ncbi:hypothetical protein E4U31_002632 [Claviceps sp. LM219 group G6]|nr:hypothetical protein E4U31_002632 [Claviceps sp. LM219 group G6]
MMASSIFSASINRAAVLNHRGSSSIRGRASRRHGLDISRHDLEDRRFHAQMPSTDSLETTPEELERVDHHLENGTRSPRGLCRLLNFRRRHTELVGHRDIAFSPFNQSVLSSRLESATRRLFRRILRFVSSENQWVSVEGRVATPCASENGDDDEDSEYEHPVKIDAAMNGEGLITRVFLHDRIRSGPCRCRHNRPNIWVSHQDEVPEDVIRVRTGQVRNDNVLTNREFDALALEMISSVKMADGTRTSPAAATGRVTHSTAQAAASTSSASHDKAEYLTRDMLSDRLSRFADYLTAAWQDRRATINPVFTTTGEHWTLHNWEEASSRPRQEIRDVLEVNGIYVGKGLGSKIAENLHRGVSRCMCDDDGGIEQPKAPKTDSHFNEQGDLVTDDGIDRPASLQQHFTPRVYATLAYFFQQLQAPLQITPSIS